MSYYEGSIPTEIVAAFKKHPGYTLLVKGTAGSGKTIFSLELLRQLSKDREALYLSTRVDVNTFIDHIDPITLADSNCTILSAFDTTSSFFSKKTGTDTQLTYMSQPEFSSTLYQRLTGTKDPKIVIIDSIDALRANLNAFDLQFENMLLEICKETNSSMVFVSEVARDDPLDYLVDGIITLEDQDMGMGRLRNLVINKLRGGYIPQKRYLFTLHNGCFSNFPPYIHKFPAIMRKVKPIGDPRDNYVSTGNSDYDSLLNGGFELGSWILIEVTHAVGQGLQLFYFPLVTNHLALGRGLKCVVPEGLCQDRTILENFVENDLLECHARWFVPEVQQQSSNERLLNDDGVKAVHEIQSVETSMSNCVPCLIMLGLDTLENIYSVHLMNKIVARSIALTRKMKNVTVAIYKENQEWNLGTAAPSAHWKLDVIGKSLTLQGIFPQTGVFVLNPDLSKGHMNYRLIPIV